MANTALLDRDDSLSGHTDPLSQFDLCHLVRCSAEGADVVGDPRRLGHLQARR